MSMAESPLCARPCARPWCWFSLVRTLSAPLGPLGLVPGDLGLVGG